MNIQMSGNPQLNLPLNLLKNALHNDENFSTDYREDDDDNRQFQRPASSAR